MKTILCYGDSNTYGYNPETGFRYPYEQRWTSILQKNLGDSAIVIPEGLNGRTTCFEDQIRPGRNGAVYLDPCLPRQKFCSCHLHIWEKISVISQAGRKWDTREGLNIPEDLHRFTKSGQDSIRSISWMRQNMQKRLSWMPVI